MSTRRQTRHWFVLRESERGQSKANLEAYKHPSLLVLVGIFAKFQPAVSVSRSESEQSVRMGWGATPLLPLRMPTALTALTRTLKCNSSSRLTGE